MNIWIIYNNNSTSATYYKIIDTMKRGIEFWNLNYDIIPVTSFISHNYNISLISKLDPDYILFWDKNWNIAIRLKEMGFKFINSPYMSLICDNKFLTLKILNSFPNLIPKTQFCTSYENFSLNDDIIFPIVLKLSYSELSNNVYFIDDMEYLHSLITTNKMTNFMLQNYLDYSPNTVIKMVVTKSRLISCYKKCVVNKECTITPYIPTEYEVSIAIKCCKIMNLDFVGVDLLYQSEGQPFVCELNIQSNFYTIYKNLNFNPVSEILKDFFKQQ